MNERYVIEKIGEGWFTGIDYEGTGGPAFCPEAECVRDSAAVLFRTEAEAFTRLTELYRECKNMQGVYSVRRLIFIGSTN